MPTPPLSSHDFRKALGHFTTGVTVITVEREPGKIQGMTANSFTSVSLNPMLILVCVDHRARMLPFLEKKKHFGVSVLKAEQVAFSEYFARSKHSAEAEARLGIHFREIADQTFIIEDTLVQPRGRPQYFCGRSGNRAAPRRRTASLFSGSLSKNRAVALKNFSGRSI